MTRRRWRKVASAIALTSCLGGTLPGTARAIDFSFVESFTPVIGTTPLNATYVNYTLGFDAGDFLLPGETLRLDYAPIQPPGFGYSVSPNPNQFRLLGDAPRVSCFLDNYVDGCVPAPSNPTLALLPDIGRTVVRPDGSASVFFVKDPLLEAFTATERTVFGYVGVDFGGIRNSGPPPYPVIGFPRATILDAAGNFRVEVAAAVAGGYESQGMPKGVFATPAPSDRIPEPAIVPGKEYSDRADRNAAGAASREQTLLWDGIGGVDDGFKYGDVGEVDEMANVNDALFDAVVDNRAALLFSTTGDGVAPILVEPIGGSFGIWASELQINRQGVDDLDGLEVWGPEQSPNADLYSLVGDAGGVAVFSGPSAGSPVPAFTVAELADAIGLDPSLRGMFDLDGLMVNGDRILFSIAPVGPFDGGEIWIWRRGDAAAQFLFHGGHEWSTAFDVMGTFGTLTENIDALEAVAYVPEPSSLAMLGAGALGLIAYARLRRRRTA